MLLTLHATSLRSMLAPADGAKPRLSLFDLPAFAKGTLGLSGLNLSTDLLVGADRAKLEGIRERADKSGCACLLLVESAALPLADADAAVAGKAVERMKAVIRAAHILGCNSAALSISGPDTEIAQALTIRRLKEIAEPAERLDLNVLLCPSAGLTAVPEKVTDLIKKVGGFRIGTLPDFLSASKLKDPVAYLRRLTPYASCVTAVTIDFDVKTVNESPTRKPAAPEPEAGAGAGKLAAKPAEPDLDDDLDDDLDVDLEADLAELAEELEGESESEPVPREVFKHRGYDLEPMVNAVLSVGYDGSLGIDYRGDGDVTIGITRSRDALRALLAAAGRQG